MAEAVRIANTLIDWFSPIARWKHFARGVGISRYLCTRHLKSDLRLNPRVRHPLSRGPRVNDDPLPKRGTT
jgi:hypothetical protein